MPILTDDLPLHQIDYQTPESELIEKEKKELVHQFVNKLPEHYKEVINLYYFEQLSYNEIGIKLDIAKKTVETRLYRAKQLLQSYRKEIDDDTYLP